jgi:hypothetical protein
MKIKLSKLSSRTGYWRLVSFFCLFLNKILTAIVVAQYLNNSGVLDVMDTAAVGSDIP